MKNKDKENEDKINKAYKFIEEQNNEIKDIKQNELKLKYELTNSKVIIEQLQKELNEINQTKINYEQRINKEDINNYKNKLKEKENELKNINLKIREKEINIIKLLI